MHLVSTQVLERCKRYAEGSHSLTLVNECPARASYRLELKRPSPQASYRTTESSAVSRVTSVWVYQITLQHGKGNSAQPCAHILSSPKGQWEKMDKECPPQTKCCLKALSRPMSGVVVGLLPFQRKSRGCLEGVSATVPQVNPNPKQVSNSRNILCQ